MATITGSGKWIRVAAGAMSCGSGSTTYSNMYAATAVVDNKTYYGFTDSTLEYLDLPNLTDFTMGYVRGYTGTVKMYSYFYTPYQCLIWDPKDMKISDVKVSYQTYRFVDGFFVGTV